MNEKLIKLYFEIEKKLPEEEYRQIEDVKKKLKEKLAKTNDGMIADQLSQIIGGKLSLKDLVIEAECLKSALESIAEILGDELIQAKKIRDEMTIKKILEQKEK